MTTNPLSPQDRHIVRTLADELATWRDDGVSALARNLESIGSSIGFEATVAYGLDYEGEHTPFSFVHAIGTPSGAIEKLSEFVAHEPAHWGHYDPFCPEESQRNRAIRDRVDDIPRAAYNRFLEFTIPLFEMAGRDQVRVLVCDGPTLLGWVGGLKRDSTQRELAMLSALAPTLQRRLRLERTMQDAHLDSIALAASLDALSVAAFVVDARMRVRHANAAADVLLATDRRGITDAIRDAIAGMPTTPTLDVTRLSVPGLGAHYLVVARVAADHAGLRATRLAMKWSLTKRQREVLALIAQGMANKTIAATLKITEPTVEYHVTSLLDRAGADNRAALVALFWTSAL